MSYIEDDELRAVDNLSFESKKMFKQFGEDIFGKPNFKGREIVSKADQTPEMTLNFIQIQLRDGIHPNDLDESEVVFMIQQKGEKWYEEWGYTKDEIDF